MVKMNTFEKLISVCNAVFEGDVDTSNVTLDSKLKEDVGINSVGLLYMAMALEEEFGIKFKNDDFAGISTVGDVVDCINAKL